MGPYIASLPQYDLPEIRSATDAWWRGIAHHMTLQGIDNIPDVLARTDDNEAVWKFPNVLLTQTCGYPLMTELRDYLKPIAIPLYDCNGCDGATYSSAVIVSADSAVVSLEGLRGMRAAVNNWNSHSGMNALRHTISPLAQGGRFFSNVVISGGHALSIEAVGEGRADVAAVDNVTLALLRRHNPDALRKVRILAWTQNAPSLPYATNVNVADDLVRKVQAALMAAAIDPDLAVTRDALMLKGFELCDVSNYQAMIDFKEAAEASGYPVIQ